MNARPPRTMRLTSLILALAVAGMVAARLAAAEPTRAEEAAFREAVERVAGAVVRIEPLALSTGSIAAEAAAGSGPSTGLVVASGRVLTTAFAVPADVDSAVVVLPDGGRRAATVRARDTSRGLVLLAVDDLPEPPPLEAVRRADLRPGQWAIAVGRGWDAATASPAVGIISAVDRVWGKAVQTDAAVSPVNYGGPLVDIAGRVIGVLAPLPAETAGMTEGTELYDAGIAFAVPFEDILAVLPRLERGESLAAGILGIGYRSRDTINGEPVIASVRQGSPAAQAGLRPGDRIVRIAGRDVTRIADARHALAPRYAGDTIALSVARGDGDAATTLDATATLVETLPPWRRAVIGVVPRPAAGAAAAEQGGPVIARVLPGGPADRAGLRAGDRLTTLTTAGAAATLLDSPAAAAGALAGVEPGQPITLSFTRDGQPQTVDLATAPLAGAVPAAGPPREPVAADPLAGPKDPVDAVRLEAADVADPPLAVIPRGTGPVGVLVWCGAPNGKAADGEATPWKAAAARHDVAVILPGSAAADAWSRDDIDGVTRALASLHSRRPLDPARIAIAGSDAGAAFAWLVAERLGGGVGGVALVGTGLPRRAAIDPATPGTARWLLLGPGSDEAARQRIAADTAELERAGHAVGLVPADEGDPPTDLLCRWVTLLGLL